MTDHGVVWWFLVKLYVPMQIDLHTGKDDVAASPAMTTWDYSSQDQGSLHPNDQTLVPQTELYGWDWTTTHTVCYQKLRTQRWWTTDQHWQISCGNQWLWDVLGFPIFTNPIGSKPTLTWWQVNLRGKATALKTCLPCPALNVGPGFGSRHFRKPLPPFLVAAFNLQSILKFAMLFSEALKLSDDFSSFSDIIVDFPFDFPTQISIVGDFRYVLPEEIFSVPLQAEDGRSGGWGGRHPYGIATAWDGVASGFSKSLLLKMAIEIVDLPTKNGDFLQLCKRLPEGNIFLFLLAI